MLSCRTLKSMGHREISHLPASCGNLSPTTSWFLLLVWRRNWNIPETWVWSQGKGEETAALPRKGEKHVAGQICLKSLGRQLKEKGTACALATVTPDRKAASQEHGIARGKHLHDRVVCAAPADCVTWHTSGWHSWITSLRCFILVPDITLASHMQSLKPLSHAAPWSLLMKERFTRSTCRHHLHHPLSPLGCKCSFSTQHLDKLKSSKVKWEIEI